MSIHSSGLTVFSFLHIEGNTLGLGEEVDGVAGGASGMGVDKIVEAGYRTSEGKAAGLFGASFRVGSTARLGTIGSTKGLGARLVLTRS